MNSPRISLRDIAHAAGVSKTTVGAALQNRPGVNQATREKILRISRRLGYVPDPRIARSAVSAREVDSDGLLPIIWLNSTGEEDAWRTKTFLSPYLEGATVRARELGYRVEELWLRDPKMTYRRLTRILHQRGIEGLITTQHVRYLRIPFDHLAGVALEGFLRSPSLHQVHADAFYNLLLSLKMLVRYGYRRIGVCLTETFDLGYSHAARAAIYYFQATNPKLEGIPPLFYLGENKNQWPNAQRQISEWLSHCKPDVIICHSNKMVALIESSGYVVPDQLGVVHLATDDDVTDWAGIASNRRLLGASAVELVAALIAGRQFGVPQTARSTVIRGTWHEGRTLLVPNPR